MEDARADFSVINYSFNYYSWISKKETGLIHFKIEIFAMKIWKYLPLLKNEAEGAEQSLIRQ